MRCRRLFEVSSLDFDVVWVKLGTSIGGGNDDVISGSGPASLLVKGGDLALSDESSGLTRSRSSLNSLAADLVRVYDGLQVIFARSNDDSSSLDKKAYLSCSSSRTGPISQELPSGTGREICKD